MERSASPYSEAALAVPTEVDRTAASATVDVPGRIDAPVVGEEVPNVAEQLEVPEDPRIAIAEMLYREYRLFISRIAYQFAQSGVSAEDLVQEVIEKAIEYDISRVDNLEGFLATITMNMGRSLIRHEVVRRKHTAMDESYNTEGYGSDVSEDVLRRMIGADVRGILESLPKRQREALTLAYYQDLTDEEIAKEMKITLGAVKSHKSRGRIAVKLAMSKKYPEDFAP